MSKKKSINRLYKGKWISRPKMLDFFFVLMSITNEQIIPRLFPRIQDPNCVMTLQCFIFYFQKNSEGFDIAKHSNPKCNLITAK